LSEGSAAGGRIPRGHAVRDALVVAATLAIWALDARLRGDGTVWVWITAVGAGTLTAISGYLFHEWGHFAGALAAGSAIRLPDSAREIFLFNFDIDRNTPRQFVVMSIGGYAASLWYVLVLAALIPLDTMAGIVAMVLVGAGLAATAMLELPPFFRVLRGGALPSGGAAYVSDANRNDTR
jgi:hypothetical protein